MKLVIGSDHAGYQQKEVLKKWLEKTAHEVHDFGTNSPDSVDYPDFAHPVAKALLNGEAQLGILLCGSGNGVAMTVNKHAGIRAALCWTEEIALLARLHNDANVVCIPARFVSDELSQKILETFLTTTFEAGRHKRRVDKINC